jgi:hypothetical protein
MAKQTEGYEETFGEKSCLVTGYKFEENHTETVKMIFVE